MKESCPSCNSEAVMREILYGLPEFPVDESKFHIGDCCVLPNSSSWLRIECGWRGWSLNDNEGNNLAEWECPVCGSKGEIHLLGVSEVANSLARTRTFEVEITYGEISPNAMCLRCGWSASFVHTYSY